MTEPALDQVAELASQTPGAGLVPISREILADTETPVSAYLKIRSAGGHAFLFESVEGGENVGRYSFLGVSPFLEFRSRGSDIRIRPTSERMGLAGKPRQFEGDPIAELRKLLDRYRSVHVPGLPRFTGGAVGYVGYDAVRLIEAIPESVEDDLALDDIALLFFDTILAFDNVRHTIRIISNVHLSGDSGPDEASAAALKRIDATEALLRRSVDDRRAGGTGDGVIRSNTRKSDYLEKVRACRDYIAAGDIFQVVLSQRFETDLTVDPLDVYRMLRVVNPSPYMFHLDLEDVVLVGASPELLVRVEDGVVQVRPIAGTRWRGANEEEDRKLGEELLADEKERAEHIMLVDLGRNDVGRVSKYNTVRVTEQMVVERYSHVMHIVSNVRGELRDDVDAIDALFACYPAGTVSGAPKIRAMEIIDELETTRRGPYAGAVGYIDFSGNLDTCIAIRTIVVKNDKAYVQAGGGIVFDSEPEYEFTETQNKAKALFRSVEMAERGGLD